MQTDKLVDCQEISKTVLPPVYLKIFNIKIILSQSCYTER